MSNNDLQKERSLKVYIRSRTKDIFKGTVYSLTSTNEKGEFDILPTHANFLTLVSKQIILDKGMPSENRIDVDKAILNVSHDNVDVYLGL